MSIDSRNIKVLAEEAKTQRETLMQNAKDIRVLQGQVTALKTELDSLRQETMLMKYKNGVGVTS
jgi:hypothetical protein